jgi:serine/threonine protein kinase
MSAPGSASEDTEPRRIAGRYRLTEPLGAGAMGTVWSGYDEVLHRNVAIKELRVPPGVPEGEMVAMRERMMREARTLGGLSHPNVITLYDVVDVGGDPYVVMELLPSRNLSDVIGDQGRLSMAQAATVGLAMASALQAAHRANITHRDVKPGNVLVAHDGRIKLTDFGIARKRDDTAMTQTGLVLGSPAYIAPEVAAGRPVTPAADLWGLGATLFAAVEARSPYDVDGDPVKTVTAVVHDDVPRAAVSGPLADVIGALMVKDPEQRMSLADVKRRLRPLLEDPEDPLFPGSPEAFAPTPQSRTDQVSASASRPSVASPSVFTPPVQPPAASGLNQAVGPYGTGAGTTAARRWTTTKPDGSVSTPLADDPGPVPGTPPRNYAYPTPPPPARPSWQQQPSRPPANRPAPMPLPQQGGLSGKWALPVLLAGAIAVAVAAGTGLGWAGTRSLVGQPVNTTDVVSAANTDADSPLRTWVDDSQNAAGSALNFTLSVPSSWEQYRAGITAGAPVSTVRWVSPDGSRELCVIKITGTKTHPITPAQFTKGFTTAGTGMTIVPQPNAGDASLVSRIDRIDRASKDGRSKRLTYTRLVQSGDNLWALQLAVPDALADAASLNLFSTISASFKP